MRTVKPARASRLRPRPSATVRLELPVDVVALLETITTQREETTYQALIRSYIGRGLRRDRSRQFYDRVLTALAPILARQHSPNEVGCILTAIGRQAEVQPLPLPPSYSHD